jgi:hypothetical protein
MNPEPLGTRPIGTGICDAQPRRPQRRVPATAAQRGVGIATEVARLGPQASDLSAASGRTIAGVGLVMSLAEAANIGWGAIASSGAATSARRSRTHLPSGQPLLPRLLPSNLPLLVKRSEPESLPLRQQASPLTYGNRRRSLEYVGLPGPKERSGPSSDPRTNSIGTPRDSRARAASPSGTPDGSTAGREGP